MWLSIRLVGHDEFAKISNSSEFGNYFYNVIKKEDKEKFIALEEVIDGYDGFR